MQKVYIKTAKDIKEYKVSANENKWGQTAFIYTDKVEYQHKTYEFKIPLSELDIDIFNSGTDNISLIIEAYGTASLSRYYLRSPCASFDPVQDNYFITYSKDIEYGWEFTANSNIEYWPSYMGRYGRFYNENGYPISGEKLISDCYYFYNLEKLSSVYWKAGNEEEENGYFAVWIDEINVEGKGYKFCVLGQKINSDGSLNGSKLIISSGDCDVLIYAPRVAYDSKNNVFLVVWVEDIEEGYQIHPILCGRFINANNGEMSSIFTIGSSDEDEKDYKYYPDLAFDEKSGCFLVVWYENDYFTSEGYYQGTNIYGQLVDYTAVGKTIGDKFVIGSSEKDDVFKLYPSVAGDGNGNFLVVWQADSGDEEYGKIFGAYVSIIDITGNPVAVTTVETVVGETNGVDFDYCAMPAVAYGSGYFLVVWEEHVFINDMPEIAIFYQLIDASERKPAGTKTKLTESDKNEYNPCIAYNSNNPSFLVAFEEIEREMLEFTGSGGCDPEIYSNIGTKVIFLTVEPEQPRLVFDPDIYNVKVGESKQACVKLLNYDVDDDGVPDETIVTDEVYYWVDDPELAAVDENGLITGLKEGTTTVYAGFPPIAELMPAGVNGDQSEIWPGDIPPASATINVTAKVIPPPIITPVRTPIGEIIVDDKVVQTIYREDVKDENGTFVFKTSEVGNNAKLWLRGSFFDEIREKYPEGLLVFEWDLASYQLPLKCVDVKEIIKELNTTMWNSKVFILIEKVMDKDILSEVGKAAEDLGASILCGTFDFRVGVDSDSGGSKYINAYDCYVTRTINKLDKIDPYSTTAMKYIDNSKVLTFAPSIFEKSGDGNKAIIKYRGNGKFTVIYLCLTFEDIQNHWSRKNVEKLATRQIVFGKGNGNYHPDEYVTRAEFAVMITRALGITEEEGTEDFEDVNDEWFAEDIRTAFKAGLINGSGDGRFYPQKYILRQDMAIMIYNALTFVGIDVEIEDVEACLSKFSDAEMIDDYAKHAAAVCTNTGIIIGRDKGDFDPHANATRAEAAAIIERMLQYLKFIN
ncbi:MAG TPA: hypothetical protein GXX14_07125 [Clostridiaceae bacterium]|nr:hypothetical protein [Clostridiaceae bacterium]